MLRVFLLLLSASLAAAYSLTGRIVDDENRSPLAGAHIMVKNTSNGTTADLDGRFRLELSERDPQQLLITHLGYDARTFRVTAGRQDLGTITLRATWLDAGEMVYTADAVEQTTRSATTKVDVVPRATLERTSSQELSRVLEVIPGISIKRSDGATTNSLSIRGSSNLLGGGVGNRVMLLVDGRPMISGDTGGPDWSMIPLAVIDRVEVAKGSYSSLYGSAAMGGVIHLVTMRRFPRHMTLVQAGYGMGELPVSEQRFRDTPFTENHLSVTHTNQMEKLGYYLSYSKRESNGHRQNSDYLHHALASRFRFGDPAGRSQFEANFNLSHLNRGFPHTWASRAHPLHLNTHHPEYVDDRQEKSHLSTDVNWKYVGERVVCRLLAWSHLGLSETMYHDDELTDTRSDADVWGLRATADMLRFKRHEVILGAEFLTNVVDGKPADVFYGDHQDLNYALFVQDQIRLATTAGNWLGIPMLQLGLRADRHVVVGHSEEDLLSPKVGFNLPGAGPLENWTFRASWGTAFRSPTIADLFLKSVPGNDYTFTANPDLNAEESRSWEAGLNWSSNGLSLDLTHFDYRYRDMIHYQETGVSSIFEIVNLQRATIRGWEVEAGVRRRNFAGSLGYTMVDSENEDTGQALPYQPVHHLNGSASWMPGKWTLSGSLRHVSETEVVRFYQSDAPAAYSLLGAKASYDLGHVEVSASVENLTDVAYEEMERYRMPGRVWRLDLLFRLGGADD
jgi:vitamin B12 transporter